ncbi:MAG: hypothetical protein A2297_00120 [Elusimicrobia bacterium RIFOXYB2_FULL_48_7]|nr:MAG: hypothetical protein A2297_00120 [Elusimicrobia bacterium RIFOXYB2_FULL_48_7]
MKKTLFFAAILVFLSGIFPAGAQLRAQQQDQPQLNSAAKEMSQLCTATQSRYTVQEVNAICEAAKEAVQSGATQREMVKLARSLMLKNISGQDLAATIDLVKLAIKEGLTPEEARTAVALQALNSLKNNQSGAALCNQVAVALTSRIAARAENLEESKKMFLTMKQKLEEIIRERYGDAVAPAVSGPATGDDKRKPKR